MVTMYMVTMLWITMGNRDYKKFGAGEYYHVYNRGNAKQKIFIDDQDFSFFLFKLRQNLFPSIEHKFRTPPLPKGSFSLISYCLMPNHFHFLIKQNSDIPITKLLLRVCTSYSIYFNKKYERVGHLFQDQYKLVLVDNDSYLNWLSAYIHQNPSVAGLVKHPVDYQWSSYCDFVGVRRDDLCEKDVVLDRFKNKSDFEQFVLSSFGIIKEKKELEDLLIDL